MPVFDSLLNKLQEVTLSDLNHELGKAKENLVYGSSNYLQNFKEDAATVGSLIRSESTRFGDYIGRIKPGLPKSTSLPVIQGQDLDGCSPCAKVLGEKYKYRSTTGAVVQPVLSPTELYDEESVVNKFIKVVGAQDYPPPQTKETKAPSVPVSCTREDILKKLASFGEEEEEQPPVEKKQENNNLEICFINETAIEDTEDTEDVCFNPLEEESESDEEDFGSVEELAESKAFPRSKSDWEAFRNPNLSKEEVAEIEERRREERRRILTEKAERRKRRAQNTARLALSQCGQIARRQILLEKERRSNESKLKKLIGLNHDQINQANLVTFNVSTLQVILNDLRDSIENYNTELVQLLISKDELQAEQESMLIDIEDISQSR